MNWRIYRLPGSRQIWHIDSGPGTEIVNVLGYKCAADTESVDIGGQNVPRAWIAVYGDLHIVNGIALFSTVLPNVEKDIKVCAVTPCA
jgi:hypothetical protein